MPLIELNRCTTTTDLIPGVCQSSLIRFSLPQTEGMATRSNDIGKSNDPGRDHKTCRPRELLHVDGECTIWLRVRHLRVLLHCFGQILVRIMGGRPRTLGSRSSQVHCRQSLRILALFHRRRLSARSTRLWGTLRSRLTR